MPKSWQCCANKHVSKANMFIGIISTPFPATFGTTTVLDLAISTLSLCLHFSACNHKTEDKKHFILCSFFFSLTISERMYKTIKIVLFFCCACVVGGPFEASPSGWRPPSLLSCDASDETWLTNFNKQVPAVDQGVGWAGSQVRYLFCRQPARPALTRQDRCTFTWGR